MIFVDTSAWYAAHVVEDPAHEACRAALLAAPTDLLTTDYVVDELLTLLSVRGHRDVAVRIGADFWHERTASLAWADRDDIEAAWVAFSSFRDKRWSFTDCVSYAVMKRLGIHSAIALDEHFRQFGFAEVKP